MPAKPKTYTAAVEQARAMLAAARLADPDDHFPYKIDEVLAVLDADPPMGPGVPGGVDGAEDVSRNVGDYMTVDIANASHAHVAAQEAWLASPTAENRSEYEATRDRLVAARLDHRTYRGDGFTVGAAARRAG
jgi:hypothetical protein